MKAFLGHFDINTTERYLPVSKQQLVNIKGPLLPDENGRQRLVQHIYSQPYKMYNWVYCTNDNTKGIALKC